ncbi:unnamed protein product [Allacma fusca]|uniref:PPM-type phosphatase domain-containing protein n=1 Tax=Allacma fusca TaxID=39272 RepID=A0A8J2NXG6_9HEXA|nr:unnamed protein product [Allacma fusca]
MGSTKYCIDATQDDGSIGRLINHRDPGNIKPVKYGLRSNIGVYFVAIKPIKLGEELFWNYNDQNPEARQSNPWLKKTSHAAKEPESSLLPACQIVFDVGSKLENSYTDGVVVNMNDYLTLRIEMAANIGQKPTMEDVIQCKGIFANGEFVLSACVFDGHGGSNAAHYASTNLIKNIISENDSDGLLGLNGLRNAFEITNNNMKADYRTWPKSKKGGPSTSGTTATVLLLSKENYSLGYVGDSKLFTFSRAKTPKLYCQIIPHNLQNAGEIQRVCRDGGFIDVRRNNYTLCVTVKDQPVSLNMTRSLGNFWSYTSKGNYAISSVAKKIVRKYTTPPKSFPMKQPGAMKTTEKKSHVRKLFPESHTMGVSCSPPITPLSELPESDKNKKTELPTGVLIVQEMSDAARNDKEALSKQLIPESPPLVTDNQSKTDSTGRKHGKLGRFVSKPKEERKPRPPYIYTGYKRKPADFSPPRTRKATQTNTKTTKINFPRKCSKPLTLKFPFNKSKGKQRKTRLSSSTSEESE